MNPILREILERHGFGAIVALLLMYAMYSYAPAFLRHTERDANREAVLLSICLNTSKGNEETQRCWLAITGAQVK
jgi:hypothetical protein